MVGLGRSMLVVPMAAVVALLVLCSVLQGAVAKSSAKNAVSTLGARKEDIKYIKCGVCEEMVKQLYRQVKKKREKIAPKKLTELEIIDLTENLCNIKKEEADWLMHLDIVEDGDKLKLVEQAEEGECNRECKTIERACQEVMGDHDTDVAEFLYKGEAQRSALSKLLCKDLSRACVGKPPPVPKDREPGEPFTPKPSKDAEMAKLMRSMSDMPGAPGMQMYSRDQLMKGGAGGFGGLGMGGGDDDDDEDDDEDDAEEEASFSKAGSSGQAGFLDQAKSAFERLKSGAQTAFETASHHARKATRDAKRWWSGSSKASKKGGKPRTAKRKPRQESKSNYD